MMSDASSDASRSRIGDIKKNWLGLAISFALLMGISLIVDWDGVREAFVLADARYFIPSIFFLLMSLVIRSISWRVLLQGRATVKQTFFALNEGYLFNNILPFRMGELVRGLLLSRSSKLPFLQIMSTVVIERIFDLLAVATMLLITLPFVTAVDWARPAANFVSLSVLVGLGVLYLIARNRAKTLDWFAWLQDKIPLLKKLNPVHIDTLFDGLHVLQDARRFFLVLFLMATTWGFIALHYYYALLAFVPDVPLIWAIFGLGVVGLGVAVPAAPGSLGVVEGLLVSVFPLVFGLSVEVALAYALSVHVLYLTVTSVLGMTGLTFVDNASIGQIYRDVRGMGKGNRGNKVDKVDKGNKVDKTGNT